MTTKKRRSIFSIDSDNEGTTLFPRSESLSEFDCWRMRPGPSERAFLRSWADHRGEYMLEFNDAGELVAAHPITESNP
jgi:hypothetical protein